MGKKLLSLVLAAAMLLTAAGCATDTPAASSAPSTQASAPSSEQASQPAASEPAKSDVRIGVVYTMTGRGDMAFNDATYEGAERAAKDFGIKVDHTEPKNLSEMEMALEDMSASGDYDLIIGISFECFDAMMRTAPNYPDQKYALVDVSSDLPNIVSYIAKENESAFLVGALAALLQQYKPENGMVGDGNAIGIIGALDADVINRHITGYTCGAKYINPDIKVFSDYVGNFSDTATAQTLAETMHKMGADIIYNASAGAGLGIFKAAADGKFLAIGLDSNQNLIDPDHIVASSRKFVDEYVYSAIKDVVNNEFKGGQLFMMGLKEKGVGYSVDGSNIKIDPKVTEIVDQIAQKIISGELQVPTTKDQIDAFVQANHYQG